MNPTAQMYNSIFEVVGFAKDVIITASAVTGAIVGVIGLQTWRRSLRGASEYARARELQKAVFRVRNAFDQVRSPAIFSYEYPEEMRNLYGHLQEEFRYKGMAHVYETRWKVL